MKKSFKKGRISGLVSIALCLGASGAFAADYDLVIENGRVMDPESMLDAVLNVGIKDGQIIQDQQNHDQKSLLAFVQEKNNHGSKAILQHFRFWLYMNYRRY